MKLSKLSTGSEVDASKQALNNSSDIRSKMCKHIRDDKTCDISGKPCMDITYCHELIPFSFRQETDDARLKQTLYINMVERSEMCCNLNYLPSKVDFHCDKHKKRCIDVINCSEDCILPLSAVCPVCEKVVQAKTPDYIIRKTINSFEIQLFHKECVQNKKVKNNDAQLSDV